jgi:hypothetical protein
MKHPRHTYEGFIPAISERDMTTVNSTILDVLSVILLQLTQ